MGNIWETSFLRQRLSVAIQRGNAASILSSSKNFFTATIDEAFQTEHCVNPNFYTTFVFTRVKKNK